MLNTDVKRELDHMANFFRMVIGIERYSIFSLTFIITLISYNRLLFPSEA